MTEENATTEQEQTKLEVSGTINTLTDKMQESFGKDVRHEFVDVYMTVVERAMGLTEEDEADVMQAALDFSSLSMAIMGKEEEEIKDVAERILDKLEDGEKFDAENEIVADVKANMKHVLDVIQKKQEATDDSAPEEGVDTVQEEEQKEDA